MRAGADSLEAADDTAARRAVVAAMQRLAHGGLSSGTTGNVSVRAPDGFLITPTGVAPERLEPATVVPVTLEGAAAGAWRPSSEWRMHRDIYRHRAEVNAIVHVHSDYATALACARRAIPAFHYMVAMAGGDSVPCAPYAAFGTQALSDAALDALAGRRACLLANHGLVALGESLEAACGMAFQVEVLARHYWLAEQLGGATLLSAAEMTEVAEKFKTYGRQDH